MSIYLGIDFGTSNSTSAVSNGKEATLVPLESGKTNMPSALFFADTGGVLFGREGIQAYTEGEDGRLMRGLKSILGTALMEEKTLVNRTLRSFEEILAIYLQNLKRKSEEFAGSVIENVVMGRPVHFHDHNRNADTSSRDMLEKIALGIGFRNVRFQFEPIAAAFAHERGLQGEKLSLVVDLGGGTSDFTVIRLSPHRSLLDDRSSDILATSGTRVGGTNFDKRLSMASFMPSLGLGSQFRSDFDQNKLLDMPLKTYSELSEWPLVNFAQTDKAIRETRSLLRNALEPQKLERLLHVQKEKLGHRFLQVVEETKIRLTEFAEASVSMTELGLDFEVSARKAEFENSIGDYIRKISLTLDECLLKAKVKPQDIDLVILTGGSSELPVINQLVGQKFPGVDVSKNDKFGSVGLGLAYSAGHVFRQQR
ncbi:MAG: Hsp70 family protein [Alphaproteobacteria bacterium]|nr:Hsp70 family protein [Alphaproteobacteria bacterium]